MQEYKTSELLLSTASKEPISAFIGFDGFIDEIVHVVDNRQDINNYTKVKTIENYGRRLMAGSGLSTSIEIVPVFRKFGGNGPNFADPLKLFGVKIVYVGCIGKDALDPVFNELMEGMEYIGLADPGFSQCFEFDDGKVIVSKPGSLNEVTPESLVAKLGDERLLDLLCESKLIAMNNWTMIPYMSEIWEMILNDYAPRMRERCDITEKIILIDLADPEKRTPEDMNRMLAILGKYTKAGFRTVLGLNKKEACEFCEINGKKIEDYSGHPLEDICRFVAGLSDLTCLVVHPVDRAAMIENGEYFETPGPFCEKPLLTTGAGDNFNAGFVYGYIHGFDPVDSLRCGVGTSGFYVRNARSPKLTELAEFVKTF